jgi:hypothetical protein
MLRHSLLFFLALIFSISLSAQILPAEGSKLNYRLVGFSFPAHPMAETYFLEIAEGTYTEEKEFTKHVIIKGYSSDNRIIDEVPAFGKEYTWRITYLGKKNKSKGKTDLFHFATLWSDYIDTTKYKLRIIDTARSHWDMFILLDFTAVMYDTKGNPVWFLPDIPGIIDRTSNNRGLEPTQAGTFTLINSHGAFEFDYNGKLLWKAPNDGKVSGDWVEHYHHEFTRLSNGHYMIAGNENLYKEIPAHLDTTDFVRDNSITKKDGKYIKKIESGTIIEYDSAGNVVWSYRTAKNLRDEDFFSKLLPRAKFYLQPHLNSFYFDETKKELYLSYRNLNRIQRINYFTQEVINDYGKIINPEKLRQNNVVPRGLFCAQHSVRVTQDGLLYLFNNNTDRDVVNPSTIAVFKQPQTGASGLTKMWEFSCDIDSFASAGTGTGGSVQMLEGGSIMACMGISGRVFVVNPQKQIIWNAIPYSYDREKKQWSPLFLYRASAIENKRNLKKFIFR